MSGRIVLLPETCERVVELLGAQRKREVGVPGPLLELPVRRLLQVLGYVVEFGEPAWAGRLVAEEL
jgi:hypothetical protein